MARIKFSFIFLLLLCSLSAFAGSQSVTMNIGDTKTLYLPSSVTSLRLKSCQFYACSPEYADIKSHTTYSVTVIAKKALSTPVIIRCDYVYYVLRNGKYVYGGRGFYDFRITVKDIPVTKITLPETETLEVGKSKTLKPTIYPSNASSALTWSSSSYAVINVDQTGRILAQKTGTSVITVTSANGKSASCTVTAYRNDVTPDLVLTDKQDAPSIPAKANVTYKRTFYSGWNSLCVPFKVKASYIEGCKLAVIKDRETGGADRYFSLTMVEDVSAGTPCLVWVEKDTECTFQLKEQVLAADPVNTGIMKGSYTNSIIGAGYYKLQPNGKCFSITSSEKSTVTSFRTYIKLQ